MINHLIAEYIKKIALHKMTYFAQTYSHSKNKIEQKLDLSNYITKYNLKGSTGIDT